MAEARYRTYETGAFTKRIRNAAWRVAGLLGIPAPRSSEATQEGGNVAHQPSMIRAESPAFGVAPTGSVYLGPADRRQADVELERQTTADRSRRRMAEDERLDAPDTLPVVDDSPAPLDTLDRMPDWLRKLSAKRAAAAASIEGLQQESAVEGSVSELPAVLPPQPDGRHGPVAA